MRLELRRVKIDFNQPVELPEGENLIMVLEKSNRGTSLHPAPWFLTLLVEVTDR